MLKEDAFNELARLLRMCAAGAGSGKSLRNAEYYQRIRKYGFCTYVRSLTNQIKAVIHSRMSDSIGYTWPSSVSDDLHAERVGEQSQSYRSKVCLKLF